MSLYLPQHIYNVPSTSLEAIKLKHMSYFLFIDAHTSTGYGLGNQGVVIRFPRASRTDLEPSGYNPMDIGGSFPDIWCWLTHLHQLPMLRMSGAIYLLPPHAHLWALGQFSLLLTNIKRQMRLNCTQLICIKFTKKIFKNSVFDPSDIKGVLNTETGWLMPLAERIALCCQSHV